VTQAGWDKGETQLTMTELTVQPLLRGQRQLGNLYRAVLLWHPHLALAGITVAIARRAAEPRARQGVRTIDAQQVAAALNDGATGFVTNDRTLRAITELDVLVLSDSEKVRGGP